MKFSSSRENYLKTIYHLQQQKDIVTTNELANALQTKPSSITDMLKKLKLQRLLNYERYRGFKLNEQGCRMALYIIRKHRLWEYFLVNKLQFGWDEVHDMAEELEHFSNQKFIDRLDAFLDYPISDPHGDPIPGRDGKFTRQPKRFPLTGLREGKTACVCSVNPQTNEMLELLQHKNLLIGTRIKVVKRFSFDDSIELKIGSRSLVTVSSSLAKSIFVNDGQ